MSSNFCFIDEVGLSAGDMTQPFMAIGLFLSENTNALNDSLHKLSLSFAGENLKMRRNLIGSLTENPQSLKMHELNNLFLNSRHREFKFDNLGYPNLAKYKEILDLIFAHKFQFHCVIVDKRSEDFDRQKYGNYWYAYHKFTCALIQKVASLQPKENSLIPILDYLNRPNGEESITTKVNKIENVITSIQADSRCFLLLQVTDLLLGAVVFEKKKELGSVQQASKKSLCRSEFTAYLCKKLKKEQITKSTGTLEKTNLSTTCFHVWEF